MADAGRPKRAAIAIDEHRFVLGSWLASQERLQQHRGLRPQWAQSFLASFPEESDARWAFEPYVSGAHIERLLDPSSSVVQEVDQDVIALSQCAIRPDCAYDTIDLPRLQFDRSAVAVRLTGMCKMAVHWAIATGSRPAT